MIRNVIEHYHDAVDAMARRMATQHSMEGFSTPRAPKSQGQFVGPCAIVKRVMSAGDVIGMRKRHYRRAQLKAMSRAYHRRSPGLLATA